MTDASWPGLIRARAEQYDVFATNQAAGFVSPTGPRDVLSRLSTDKPGLYRAVTGSFVAAQIAPVAAPAQLQLYVEQPEETAEGLGLLPTDRGADVILLQPYDYVVLDRPGDPRVLPGLTAVGVSQLALDLLTGNGRMPAEGEAIIAWMSDNPAWRIPDIDSPELGTRAEVYP